MAAFHGVAALCKRKLSQCPWSVSRTGGSSRQSAQRCCCGTQCRLLRTMRCCSDVRFHNWRMPSKKRCHPFSRFQPKAYQRSGRTLNRVCGVSNTVATSRCSGWSTLGTTPRDIGTAGQHREEVASPLWPYVKQGEQMLRPSSQKRVFENRESALRVLSALALMESWLVCFINFMPMKPHNYSRGSHISSSLPRPISAYKCILESWMRMDARWSLSRTDAAAMHRRLQRSFTVVAPH